MKNFKRILPLLTLIISLLWVVPSYADQRGHNNWNKQFNNMRKNWDDRRDHRRDNWNNMQERWQDGWGDMRNRQQNRREQMQDNWNTMWDGGRGNHGGRNR